MSRIERLILIATLANPDTLVTALNLDEIDDATDPLDLSLDEIDVDSLDSRHVDSVAYMEASAFASLDDEIESFDRF